MDADGHKFTIPWSIRLTDGFVWNIIVDKSFLKLMELLRRGF